MSHLRDVLIENYAEHYLRVNRGNKSRNCGWMPLRWTQLIDELPPASKVLDLGCGTGYVLEWLSGHPNVIPIGIDASPTQVAIARAALPDIEISCGDGLDYLKRHTNEFAAILCNDVLEHIPGDDLCLEWVQTARAALKPGGFFACKTPNAGNLLGCYGRYMDLTHVRSFTSTSMQQLLEAGGLESCETMPMHARHLRGWLRLRVETMIHRVIYRIFGRYEPVVTKNVCGVGLRRAA